MQITTEDAKKIAGAYLLVSKSDSELRQYRVGLITGLLAQYRVDKVKDLPEVEAGLFVRDLLDLWEKK